MVSIEVCTARDSTGVEETASMLFQKNLVPFVKAFVSDCREKEGGGRNGMKLAG